MNFKDKEIKDGEVILINVSEKKLIETTTQILKDYIMEKGYYVVYVTVNKPFSTLIEIYKREGINTDKIFIVDATTPYTEPHRIGNGVFVGSPKELTNISISTLSAIKKFELSKILILDSISTMLLYNNFDIVRDFIRFISDKMRELKITFVIMGIKELADEKIVSRIGQFCDKIIDAE